MDEYIRAIVAALRYFESHEDCSYFEEEKLKLCPVSKQCERSDHVLCDLRAAADLIEKLYAKNIEMNQLLSMKDEDTGNISDGYHTFNELYHHRAVLFSVIVKAFPDESWKSKLHHDGTMYDGMFIVGIDTPDGQASYHYDINPYWDMFLCKELERAPEWDGHTPAQAIERIGKLEPVQSGRWILRNGNGNGVCSNCCRQDKIDPLAKFCRYCGARMEAKGANNG